MAYLENSERNLDIDGFLSKLDSAVARYIDIKQDLEKILLISHSDADGVSCAGIISEIAKRDNIDISTYFFNRNLPWKRYLDKIIPKYDDYDNICFFFTDLGSEVKQINEYFAEREDYADVFILDHHNTNRIDNSEILENFHFVNPTEYGLDGLKEIAGAALVYNFAKKINLKYTKLAWMALIGISNDSLMDVSDYKLFNKEILDEAISEGQVIVKNGIRLYGSTHEKIKDALAHSILPFIPEFGASSTIAEHKLESIGVDPNIRVENIEDPEVIEKINGLSKVDLIGNYIIFPDRKGIQRYAFEYGMLLSVIGYKYQNKLFSLLNSHHVDAESKLEYKAFIKKLSKSLSLFVKTPKSYSENAIFVDAGKRIPPSSWSEVASYASVNHLYDPKRVLLLGGQDGNVVKLSIRCSEFFPPLKEGKGIDVLIQKLKKEFGGKGGGHKLAGGYRLAPNKYKVLMNRIDEFFPL